MRSGNRSNALLVELLVVILFFMLASTILLRVFSASRRQSDKAEIMTRALAEAQNVAERLYAEEEADGALIELGFEKAGEIWQRTNGEYTVKVSIESREESAGTLFEQAVSVYLGDELMTRLPATVYREAAQ